MNDQRARIADAVIRHFNVADLHLTRRIAAVGFADFNSLSDRHRPAGRADASAIRDNEIVIYLEALEIGHRAIAGHDGLAAGNTQLSAFAINGLSDAGADLPGCGVRDKRRTPAHDGKNSAGNHRHFENAGGFVKA